MKGTTDNRFSMLYNKRGIIAEQYSQLQAVHILDQARQAYPLPQASALSTVRALFQSVEIALLNLADLMPRITMDLQNGRVADATMKMQWVRGFHAILVDLSMMPDVLGEGYNGSQAYGELKITDSPAFQAYFIALKQFDSGVLKYLALDEQAIQQLIAEQSLDNEQLLLLHLARLCNHETTIWEHNLGSVKVLVEIPDYETFVASRYIYNAVYDTMLEGDTYYTQFRGLHQIPEILCAEINDHIEKAILHIRGAALPQAYEHLRQVNILAEGILAALVPIVDYLTTADYHKIRENLGLTSGSHSVGIHYHLFRDLYGQLWETFAQYVTNKQSSDRVGIEEIIRQIELNKFNEQASFLLHLLTNELLKVRVFTLQWRNEHLHLPRNNVGGNYTRSLTGAVDAVQAVKRMRDSALMRDPMQPLANARGLENMSEEVHRPLTDYFTRQDSLDAHILSVTGEITKERFKDVQERTGVFAQKSPFIPPPKREV